MIDLADLKAKALAATPGPWYLNGYSVSYSEAERDRLGDPVEVEAKLCDAGSEQDAAYIAAANPTTILALIEELEGTKAELEDANRTIKAMEDDYDERYCQP